MDSDDVFTTETTGLPEASSPSVVRLCDGDSFDLRIQPVRKRIGDAVVRMLGYNGSIPGATLHVDQGSQITVEVTNEGDVEATVHWHGLRLENRYDGVPEETQAPIPPGGTFTYKLRFPDAGLYWYHPHIREDFAQEMGLYAPIVVEPSDPSYWPAVDRQLTITLDDVLIEDGQVAPFKRSGPTFTAMGRFGNVMLTLAVVSASDHGGSMMAASRVEAEQSEQAAQALQSELANLSSNSTRRVIEGSDHGSVITNQHHAQQTSEEILKVVEAIRTGQPLAEQVSERRN